MRPSSRFMAVDSPPPFTIGFDSFEKRLEITFSSPPIVTDPFGLGLRALTPSQIPSVFELAPRTIVSQPLNTELDSYVLLEPSLFIYPLKIILETCGIIKLPLAIPQILKLSESLSLGVSSMKYSRASSIFHPHLSFSEEVSALNEHFGHLNATSYVIGDANFPNLKWHIYLASKETVVQQDPPGSIECNGCSVRSPARATTNNCWKGVAAEEEEDSDRGMDGTPEAIVRPYLRGNPCSMAHHLTHILPFDPKFPPTDQALVECLKKKIYVLSDDKMNNYLDFSSLDPSKLPNARDNGRIYCLTKLSKIKNGGKNFNRETKEGKWVKSQKAISVTIKGNNEGEKVQVGMRTPLFYKCKDKVLSDRWLMKLYTLHQSQWPPRKEKVCEKLALCHIYRKDGIKNQRVRDGSSSSTTSGTEPSQNSQVLAHPQELQSSSHLGGGQIGAKFCSPNNGMFSNPNDPDYNDTNWRCDYYSGNDEGWCNRISSSTTSGAQPSQNYLVSTDPQELQPSSHLGGGQFGANFCPPSSMDSNLHDPGYNDPNWLWDYNIGDDEGW